MKGIDFNCQFPAFFLNTEPLQKEKKNSRWKFHTLLGLLHKQNILDFGIPPRLWTELTPKKTWIHFEMGGKQGKMLSLSYDIWLPVDTQNGHTSNVKQADNGQEAPLSTQWARPSLAAKPWMKCSDPNCKSPGAWAMLALQARMSDHSAWGSQGISQIIRLQSGQQGGPGAFIHCCEMSKAEK